MLSDVTMGQFFPGKSVMHRLDPRIKMCLTVYFIVLIFCSKNFVTLGATILMSLLGVVLSKVPLKLYLKSMKPILFIVVFTGVLNLFYGTGDPIFTLGFIHITRNGIVNSIMIAVRIVVLILISSILTFTTSPTQLTDAIERLLKPLALLHVPVHEFAMMMTIALRFVPTLLEETEKIMAAQKARGADMESGGLMQRIKALIPVLIPLFVSAFRRAFDLATAMESRCYHGGEGRTKMKVLHLSKADYITLIKWWDKNANGGHLYIGQDVARTMKADQLTRKMRYERALPHVSGNCFWPANEILWNNKGVADSLKRNYHRYPALIPAYTHMHNRPPKDVSKLKTEWTPKGFLLHWQAEQSPTNPELASYFVVYRFNDKEPIDTSDPSKIVAITRETGYLMPYEKGKVKYRYVVTAVDRFHNESEGKTKKVKL